MAREPKKNNRPKGRSSSGEKSASKSSSRSTSRSSSRSTSRSSSRSPSRPSAKPPKSEFSSLPPDHDDVSVFSAIKAAVPAGPPELMAPAGSKAAWAAAVEAGADAVYLGLNDFSARTYADNFSLTELAAVIRQSHEVGVKIYLAMNALIKEGDLNKVWGLLATAASFGPDSLILQDMGLARLAARHFPHIPRQASTLTAVHSLPGLIMLQQAGFSRAVLARELAFDEVEALANHSPIEVEIFVHGALCFSFSGLCLMSSFLGGRSALQGSCTQPCRRLYQRAGKRGAFFSTTDLCTAPYFQELRQLPLAAFKIEGRMKGPDYVSRVVRVYRMLLDVPDADWPYALVEAENILRETTGRRTTGGPLALRAEGALAPLGRATTSGLKLGFLEPFGPDRGVIFLKSPVEVNDRLRLQSKAGEESPAFNLKVIKVDGQEVLAASVGTKAILTGPGLGEQSGFLYKISSGREEKAFLASPLVKKVKEEAKRVQLPRPRSLPPELQRNSKPMPGTGRPGFWLWLDRAENMLDIGEFEYKKIILPLTTPNVRHVRHNRRYLKNELPRLVWSLPPLIFYQRQNLLNQELGGLIAGGSREFLVSNLAQVNMIQRAGREVEGFKIWGDHRLGFLNHLAEKALLDLGLTGLCLSLEADSETFQALWRTSAGAPRLVYLYGHPALFTARYPLEQRNIPVVSPKGEKFYIGLEGEELIVTSDRPIFMGPLLKMPPLPPGSGFIVDLRGEPQVANKLRELKRALTGVRTSQGTTFNFKRKLI